jgi:hypothetical protein
VRICRAPLCFECYYTSHRGGFNHPCWMRRPDETAGRGHTSGTAERVEASDVQAAGDDALSDVCPEPQAEVTADVEIVGHVVADDP